MGAKPRTLLTNNVDLTVVPEPNVRKNSRAPLACSLSLAPLANFNRWRGRSTARPFH